MRVTFTRTDVRQYAVAIEREHGPRLVARSAPGYDDLMPHDVAHYVVEEVFGIRLGVFGQLAAGGAGVFTDLVAADHAGDAVDPGHLRTAGRPGGLRSTGERSPLRLRTDRTSPWRPRWWRTAAATPRPRAAGKRRHLVWDSRREDLAVVFFSRRTGELSGQLGIRQDPGGRSPFDESSVQVGVHVQLCDIAGGVHEIGEKLPPLA